ncbi:hypothetical protein [uncultured Campylobacter sp.]|uniref:hypothetical protein n=1 Tax=uncultured Campylobacter sp. TaxID=218934 RepID=UPI00260CD366|nr:hypothetical protein [uncultured Campylobacter sp.]
MERVDSAKRTLDNVEEMLRKAGVNLERLAFNDATYITGLSLDKADVKLKNGLFLYTEIGNIFIDMKNGESIEKQLNGIAGDVIIFAVARFFGGPVGIAIEFINQAAEAYENDLGSFLKRQYDKRNSDYMVSINNNILKVTLKNGTTYARPLRGHSGIVKGGPITTKSDVLFGGDGNDTLIGRSNGAGSYTNRRKRLRYISSIWRQYHNR